MGYRQTRLIELVHRVPSFQAEIRKIGPKLASKVRRFCSFISYLARATTKIWRFMAGYLQANCRAMSDLKKWYQCDSYIEFNQIKLLKKNYSEEKYFVTRHPSGAAALQSYKNVRGSGYLIYNLNFIYSASNHHVLHLADQSWKRRAFFSV